MIIYRPVTNDDFNQFVSLENECFKEPYSIDDIKYEFEENPVNKIIVAVDKDKIIGFIDYLITFNSATIMQICVTNEYRRQGIGQMLLKEMENSFPSDVEDIVETITLEVRESNNSAINLYLKCGYETITIKHKYYKDGENAIYMIKRL